MRISQKMIEYAEVSSPCKENLMPVELTQKTIEERKQKVMQKMKEEELDQLIIYCDVEHAWNFAYLVGFFTRFEEALLVIGKTGEMTLMLGNENLNKASKARIKAEAVHVSLFSLPNQPNRNDKSFTELLKDAGVKDGGKIGIVGWKNMTSTADDCEQMFDVPSFIADAIKNAVGLNGKLVNATKVFIGENGVRTTNNANEIAHYEYGAALASDCILDAMNYIDEGVTELSLGDKLVRNGQHTSVVTIAASGERFVNGNIFPRNKKVEKGDAVSLTVGYAGGSSSRAGAAVYSESDLPKAQQGYLQELAIPYFAAYAAWLEEIKIGMCGGDMFDAVEEILPRSEYHWSLCPGHLVAEEEWMSSPIYEGSKEVLRSGMIFQIDIIPSKPGMPGVSAESTVVLADAKLQKDIQEQYPDMWVRMLQRRKYIMETLGIRLSGDVFPMCSTVGYLRPYMLEKGKALRVKR